MNALPSQATVVPNASYEDTRFNALRHGVLSRYTVLPWEDETEYRTLLDAVVAEYAPDGPTEEHLVEELTGIMWRKRRLRMAEAAVYREKLRSDVTSYQTPEHLAGAALLPLTGGADHKADIRYSAGLGCHPQRHGAGTARRETRSDHDAPRVGHSGGRRP